MDKGFRRFRYLGANVTAGGYQLLERMEPEGDRYEGIDEFSLGNMGAQGIGELVGSSPVGNAHPAEGELAERTRMFERPRLFVALDGGFAVGDPITYVPDISPFANLSPRMNS